MMHLKVRTTQGSPRLSWYVVLLVFKIQLKYFSISIHACVIKEFASHTQFLCP